MNKYASIAVVTVVIALAFGYFLARGPAREAEAQGMVSEAGNTIVVVGQERNARIPIFLVDTREQTLCVYRYDFNANSLELSVARTYAWDKKLQEYGETRPDPDDVRRGVMRQR